MKQSSPFTYPVFILAIASSLTIDYIERANIIPVHSKFAVPELRSKQPRVVSRRDFHWTLLRYTPNGAAMPIFLGCIVSSRFIRSANSRSFGLGTTFSIRSVSSRVERRSYEG